MSDLTLVAILWLLCGPISMILGLIIGYFKKKYDGTTPELYLIKRDYYSCFIGGMIGGFAFAIIMFLLLMGTLFLYYESLKEKNIELGI